MNRSSVIFSGKKRKKWGDVQRLTDLMKEEEFAIPLFQRKAVELSLLFQFV
jgi:hypothetical protein